MGVLGSKNVIEGSTIKVVNHPNLFWSNYSRDKPNHFMPFNEFTDYEFKGCKKFKVDWSIEEPYHGQIKLLGNWNYAIIDGNMYFLEVKKSFGNKLYLYECIYDFWVNEILRNRISVQGTLGNTNSDDLVLKFIHTTIPMLSNPNGQRIIPIRIAGKKKVPKIIACSPKLYIDDVYEERFDPEALKTFSQELLQFKGKQDNSESDESEIKLCLFSWFSLNWETSFMRGLIKWLETNKELLKVYDLGGDKIGYVQNLKETLKSKFSAQNFYCVTTQDDMIFAKRENSSLHIDKLDFSGYEGLEVAKWSIENELKILESDIPVEELKSKTFQRIAPANLKNFKIHTNTNKQVIDGIEISGSFRLGEIKDEAQHLKKHIAQADGEVEILVGLKEIPEDFETKKTQKDFLKNYGVYEKVHLKKGEMILPLDKYVVGKENANIEHFSSGLNEWTPEQWDEYIRGVFTGTHESDEQINRDSFLGDERFEKTGLIVLPNPNWNNEYFVNYFSLHNLEGAGSESKSLPWTMKYIKTELLETTTTQTSWNTTDSPTLQVSQEERRVEEKRTSVQDWAFVEFIKNITATIQAGIWFDEPFKHLWVYRVVGLFPKAKWTDKQPHITIRQNQKGGKSPQIKRRKDNSPWGFKDEAEDAPADELEVEMNATRGAEAENRERLKKYTDAQAKIFYTFFREDWQTGWDGTTNQHKWDKLISPHIIRIQHKYGNNFFNILRFIRIYRGRYYNCDVWFRADTDYTTRIRSHYIFYRDKLWSGWLSSGQYYMASGLESHGRNHIGGLESKVKEDGHGWSDLDASLSLMLKEFETNPHRTAAWFEVLAKVKDDEEVIKTLDATQYFYIKQLDPPVNANNSRKPEYIRRFHPLSRLFWDTRKEIGTRWNQNKEGREWDFLAKVSEAKLKTQHNYVKLDNMFQKFELSKVNTSGVIKDFSTPKWWDPEKLQDKELVIFSMKGINDMLIAVYKDNSKIKYEIIITDPANIVGAVEVQNLAMKNTLDIKDPVEIINQQNTLYCYGTRFPLKFRAPLEIEKEWVFPKLEICGIKVRGQSDSEYRRLVLDTGYDYIDTVITYLKKQEQTKQIDALQWDMYKIQRAQEERNMRNDVRALQIERERFFQDMGMKRDLWAHEGSILEQVRGVQDAAYNRQYGFGIANAILGPITSIASIIASPFALAGRGISEIMKGIGGSAFRSKSLLSSAFGSGSGQILGGVQSMYELKDSRAKQLINRKQEDFQRKQEFQKMQRETERESVDYSLKRDELEISRAMKQYQWKNEIIAMNSAVNVVQTTDSDIHEAYNKLLTNTTEEGEVINTYIIQQYPKERVLDKLREYYKVYGYEVMINDYTFRYTNQQGFWKFLYVDNVDHPSLTVKREITKMMMAGFDIKKVSIW